MDDRVNKALAKMEKLREEADARIAKNSKSFPLDVLPPTMQSIVKELVKYYGFPLEFLASAMMVAAAIAIGNTRTLRYIWDEKAVLFLLLIGKPGANKSNAVTMAMAPIKKLEAQAYKAAKKSADACRPLRLLTTDTTPAALVELLSLHPRGICIWSDEVISHFNQSAKANRDMLSLFSRTPISVDRKTGGHDRIEEPFVCLVGTTQTEIAIEELGRGRKFKSGLLERLLLVEVDKEERVIWEKKDGQEEASKQWGEMINWLFTLEEEKDEHDEVLPSSILRFDEKAEEVIRQYRNEGSKCERDIDEVHKGRIDAKMDNNLLRLCIVLHCLHCACEKKDTNLITATTAEGATRLAEYYRQKAYRFWEKLSKKNPLDQLSELKLKIYHKLPRQFRTKEGVRIADSLDMPERTFKYWIRHDTHLFKRLGHGSFERKYKGSSE